MTTMKAFILAIIFGFVACGRLDSQYLPAINRGLSTPALGGSANNFNGGSYSNANNYYNSAKTYKQVPILKFVNNNNGEGTYSYEYKAANSISAEEHGDGRSAQGSYSYISPEGEHVSISYTADENGYVAQGSHLPTPPPIPEAILKSLQENAAAEARGVQDDGSYSDEGNSRGSGGFNSYSNNNYNNGGYKY